MRLALLRSGADPSKVEIVKERADTMDLGSVVQIVVDAYHTSRPMLEPFATPLTALHCALCFYEICRPARAGILLKTPRGTFKLSAHEVEIERLKQILDTADSDEHGD